LPGRIIQGTENQPHSFLTAALHKAECLASCPGCCTSREETQYFEEEAGCTAGLVWMFQRREHFLAPAFNHASSNLLY
jgi:hypothetical protein